MDGSSSEQQIHESANRTLIVGKNWSSRPSAAWSYGRQEGRLWDEIILELKILKFSRAYLEALGLLERRYSILSCITSPVLGFLWSDFYNFVYFKCFSGSHTFPCQSLLLSINIDSRGCIASSTIYGINVLYGKYILMLLIYSDPGQQLISYCCGPITTVLSSLAWPRRGLTNLCASHLLMFRL